ncbi:MAG: GNAT family N-acetyltransferase [Deltaproteobacteria bacterium]|nr:GNAT family N-acetyltransferase [Deltaproteobacteria bacterium]
MPIRAAIADDLPAIVEIYNQAVLRTTATFDVEPVTARDRQPWFQRFDDEHPLLVDEHDGRARGFACYSPYHARPGYASTKELSVYVHFDAHGHGVGTRLVQALLDHAAQRGVRVMLAVLGGDNPGSMALHRKLGFVEAGILRQVGYKFERWVDVTFMHKFIDAAAQTLP